jgi:hypothetical protein
MAWHISVLHSCAGVSASDRSLFESRLVLQLMWQVVCECWHIAQVAWRSTHLQQRTPSAGMAMSAAWFEELWLVPVVAHACCW